MGLLDNTAVCVIFLLCLHLPSISGALETLQRHHGKGIRGEVPATLEGKTHSVGLQLTLSAEETSSKIPRTGDASTMQGEEQIDVINEEKTWKKNTEKNSLEVHTDPKENEGKETGRESDDGKNNARTSEDNEDDKEGKDKVATLQVIQTSGWFTDTVNVTTRPIVTWSRRTALHRPSPIRKEELKEEDEDDILLTVKFMKENHPLILDLHPTRDLLTASYKESNDDVRGDDTLPGETRAMPCQYQGVVRGQQESWAALSVCDGLSGVLSVVLQEGEEVELLVEPLPSTTSPHEPHRVFSSDLLKLSERKCGVKDTISMTEGKDGLLNATTDEKKMTNTSLSSPHRARRWVGLVGNAVWFEKSTRFVELVLVADNSFYMTHGAKTRSRCKTIVNIANAMYRPLGVVVVLSHLEVWEDRDRIKVTSDFEQNLKLFMEYRQKMVQEKPYYNNDNTMLLTTVDFSGTTVGYAIVSGMCNPANSAGVVQDNRDHVGVVAFTLIHEMGHNFGMQHDNQMTCDCPSPRCIMGTTSSSQFEPHTLWSTCSRKVIEKNFESESYKCLRNVPTRMYQRSSCGDGVVDDDEQCDCGPAEFCNNPCCNATTCRFTANAFCASGPCCDTKKCQLKTLGVRCREAFTECDLPEFCSGNSEACPEDVTKADGTPCHGGMGHCYEAQCGSHEGMCQDMWGQLATVAEEECYSKLNKRGGSNGNCGFKGHTKTKLLPCADEDKLCGSLQCFTKSSQKETKPKLKMAVNYGTFRFSRYSCTYIVPSPSVPEWYWLTPDGAKCGDSKMCRNQKCVKVPEPSGDCRGGCSGHGVCNSRNHCHCHPGFAPPDCSKDGAGGSIDSHQSGRGRYKDTLWEAIYILSLIALGATIVTCCLWSHIRNFWETRGRGSTLPCCARCLDACCCPLMSLITDHLCTRKKNEDVSKEAQAAWEQDKMICQVDLNMNDNESHTNSWGVANERLVTEVVTMTPKNSSDFRRKIMLPSHHYVHEAKTTETADTPTYKQSISVDSGCVSDVDGTTVEEPLHTSRMSMKSLLNLFGTSSSSSLQKKNSTPKTFKKQRSVPLRSLVVDPLAGSRRSRHGTPPPNHVKHGWRRSISLNIQSTGTGQPGVLPPIPPPATEKPYKNKNKSPQVYRSTNQQVTCQDVFLQDKTQGVRTPGTNNPPAPPLVRPVQTLSSAPPPAPSLEPKKPMMPPGKKHTLVTIKKQSNNEFAAKVNAPQQKINSQQNSTPKRPLLQPVRNPDRQPAAKLPNDSDGSSKPGATGNVYLPLTKTGKVKDLAKKLEKQ